MVIANLPQRACCQPPNIDYFWFCVLYWTVQRMFLAQLAFFVRNFFWWTLASKACGFGSIFFYCLTDLEHGLFYSFPTMARPDILFHYCPSSTTSIVVYVAWLFNSSCFHVSVYFTLSGHDITFGPCMILFWSNLQRSWYIYRLAGLQTRFHWLLKYFYSANNLGSSVKYFIQSNIYRDSFWR